jgi:hypothetical protein
MLKLVVMLIWVGSSRYGGPLVIQGFTSMESCQAAISSVEQTYMELNRTGQIEYHRFGAICKEIPR